jgi:hypothetical protein
MFDETLMYINAGDRARAVRRYGGPERNGASPGGVITWRLGRRVRVPGFPK